MSALELVEQGCTISIFDQQQAGQAALGLAEEFSPMYPLCACSEPTCSIWQSLLSGMEPKTTLLQALILKFMTQAC